jgi:hypothetical protein
VTRLKEWAHSATRPWALAIFFALAVPLFPDYLTPFAAAASLIASWRDVRRRGASFRVGPVGKALLAYLAFILIGVLYSPQKVTSLGTVIMWGAGFAVYLSVSNVLTTSRRLSAALVSLAVIGGLIGVIACAQYVLASFFHLPVSMQVWEPVDKAVLSIFPFDFILDINGIRAAATFNNPNVCAEYLFMAAPFLMARAFGEKRSRSGVITGLMLLPLAAGLALTFSRGSYLALIAVVGVFCLFNLKKIWIFLLGGAAVLFVLPEAVINRFLSIKSIDGAITERLNVWKVIADNIAERPLFGVGPGTYNTWALLRDAGIDAPHAHNIALQLLAEGGIVGLVLMGTVFALLIRAGIRLYKGAGKTAPRSARLLGVAFLAFTAALLVDGIVDFPLLTPRLVGTFSLAAAFADGGCRLHLGDEAKPLFFRWRKRLSPAK